MESIYRKWGKRVLDIAIVGCFAPAMVPLLAIVAAAVRGALGSPIFFCQVRPGLNGAPFRLYKFRSMSDKTDETGALLQDHLRLTSFGRFLRSTSLDELPELWNVLRGEMSITGPRPLLMEYLPLYDSHQARRHSVRPGVTGLAQISGRNALSWREKFDLDVWYVDHYSFALDMKIMWLTVRKVVSREGINAEGAATMPPFDGAGDS